MSINDGQPVGQTCAKTQILGPLEPLQGKQGGDIAPIDRLNPPGSGKLIIAARYQAAYSNRRARQIPETDRGLRTCDSLSG